ncbi:hypothetical protein C2E20_0526 [Micractinium conductrix]|uniref:DUF1499 domain-containing protein n=1 Tax=Micractinium conductrix TaxID=554055 RepID=A0A2P6VQV3_9CHLO|nr:hypothetical protein C2E20_0526 [Micractinium conductrix]|eukprot:PSC76451.1 hypothetical protein C2E20_0526 [Micractinium conductrix]
MGAAVSAPVINDVSTHLEDPPTFSSKSSHPAALSEGVKAACRKAYADVQPLAVPGGDAAAVFSAAKRAAASLARVQIVHEDEAAGSLELLDTTRLMRYKDDVAVRVRRAADGGGVVVDVRSASRVGKGDLGCNAARIRQYLAALRGELGLSAS